MCPTGMRLDIDWKTCIPQDSDGSSPMSCGDGYKYNMVTEACEDINECDRWKWKLRLVERQVDVHLFVVNSF